MLKVKNLTVGYETPLLKEISFTGNRGEVIGILGRNGSGKTTLLRGLLGSIRRFSGEVWIAGQNSSQLSPRQLAACLSVLPQHTEILSGITSGEIMEMGRYPYGGWSRETKADTRKRVESAAGRLGTQSLLEWDCGKLSQGQRQMVLLGRLLVQDTPVMLLDEPDAALDYDNAHRIFSVLRRLAEEEGKTILLVLHNPEQALRWCDRLLILKDGAICADLPTGAEEAAVHQAVSQLYPRISLRRDPVDGYFRCYTQY